MKKAINILLWIGLFIAYIHYQGIIHPKKKVPPPVGIHYITNNSLINTVIDSKKLDVYIVSDKSVSCQTQYDRITCSDWFIETVTPEQMGMILLHEYGHIIYNHNEKTHEYLTYSYETCVDSGYSSDYCKDSILKDADYLKYSREQESQADNYAFNQMPSYGISKNACLFFAGYSTENPEMSSHPSAESRLKACMDYPST